MTRGSQARRPEAQDIAAEIVRRVTAANAETGGGYVVRPSDPPTPTERLQLLAAGGLPGAQAHRHHAAQMQDRGGLGGAVQWSGEALGRHGKAQMSRL